MQNTTALTPISVVIITYNEQQNIARCLDSVLAVADDIVVVDSFSTDHLESDCLALTAKLISLSLAMKTHMILKF